jgi:hypothetical protein
MSSKSIGTDFLNYQKIYYPHGSKKPMKTFEGTTGHMRPERVNKLPSSLPAV